MDRSAHRWFAHLRALFVAAHLLAITVMAFPAPEGGMDRAAWQDPTVQGELATWTTCLNQCGSTITHEQLEDQLWELCTEYMATRSRILEPFQDYYTYCGTGQSWRMFVAPHRYPTRLYLDVRENDAWRPVYVERDYELRWLHSQLDNYRFRSAIFRFGWESYQDDYRQFLRWVAIQAAQDFPRTDAVRGRFFKYRTPSPEEVRAGRGPEGDFILAEELGLEEFR